MKGVMDRLQNELIHKLQMWPLPAGRGFEPYGLKHVC